MSNTFTKWKKKLIMIFPSILFSSSEYNMILTNACIYIELKQTF